MARAPPRRLVYLHFYAIHRAATLHARLYVQDGAPVRRIQPRATFSSSELSAFDAVSVHVAGRNWFREITRNQLDRPVVHRCIKLCSMCFSESSKGASVVGPNVARERTTIHPELELWMAASHFTLRRPGGV